MNRAAYRQARRLCASDPDGRRIVEEAIEALLAALDEADGDPDLEDDGDATYCFPDRFVHPRCPTEDDEEDDPPEPWLGAPERHPVVTVCMSPLRGRSGDQTSWASGGRDDREDDPAELGIADLDGLAWVAARA